ncbi:MAG: hypothetical protein ACLFU8_04930 [Anaerolineales bacterium]
MSDKSWLSKLMQIRRPAPPPPVAPGLYHTTRETDGQFTRYHLRVERDGSGMLIANASAAARLTPPGVVIAQGLLEGKGEDAILVDLATRFEGTHEAQVRADIAQVKALIQAMLNPGDTFPIFSLDDALLSPFGAELIAPLQAAVPLAGPEQLLPLLDRIWEVAIPHVTLFAPPAVVPEHLVRAIERAEALGMIAGVRALATTLSAEGLLPLLWQTGADHVTVPYASSDPAVHDALCGPGDHAAAVALFDWLQENEIAAVAEVPLVVESVEMLEETVEALAALGADSLSFVAYATTEETRTDGDSALFAAALPQVATRVEEAATLNDLRFIWEPPVERDPVLTLPAQVQRGPRCSAEVAVRVESNGAVIPPRGPYRTAGNLLRDSWESIWEDSAFLRYREQVEAPTSRCEVCPGLALCAAVCPADPAGWARRRT